MILQTKQNNKMKHKSNEVYWTKGINLRERPQGSCDTYFIYTDFHKRQVNNSFLEIYSNFVVTGNVNEKKNSVELEATYHYGVSITRSKWITMIYTTS